MSAAESRPAASATASVGAPEGQDTEATGSAVQGTAERQALANVIHDGACQCRGHGLGWTVRAMDADQVAEAVLAAGYRLVVEDEDTVERVAAKIWAGGALSGWSLDMEHYRVIARAALQALRGDRDD